MEYEKIHNGYTVKIPLKPVPKERPRLGRMGVFTPTKTKRAEADLKYYFNKIPDLMTGPISIKIIFCYKAKKHGWKTTRPDFDNLAKLVADAGNGILWEDDNQIAHCEIMKVHSDKDQILMKVTNLTTAPEQTL